MQYVRAALLDNKPNISCIPAGNYIIKPVNSPKFGLTYEVCDVKGRTHILFHKGNFVDDSLGCILPCNSYGILMRNEKSEFAGLSSKVAYDKLMTLLDGSEYELEIKRY